MVGAGAEGSESGTERVAGVAGCASTPEADGLHHSWLTVQAKQAKQITAHAIEMSRGWEKENVVLEMATPNFLAE